MPYIVNEDKRAFYRERPWVIVGGIFLSAHAGYVNVVLLGYFHVPVSHMSGAVSRLGIDMVQNNAVEVHTIVGIFIGFLIGSILSGAVIGGRQLVPGRRYGVVLFVEGILLSIAAGLLTKNHKEGVMIAAMACGLQNAMASAYHGLVLRTSHVTGVVTDIGVLLGHWLRHKKIEKWKLVVLISVLGGFFTGGLAGAVACRIWGVRALWISAALCLLAGNAYYVWKQLHRSWLTKQSDRYAVDFWWNRLPLEALMKWLFK